MMGYPANCCLFGSLRNDPPEATALAASQAFRGGCRPGQAKIPADPESGALAFRNE